MLTAILDQEDNLCGGGQLLLAGLLLGLRLLLPRCQPGRHLCLVCAARDEFQQMNTFINNGADLLLWAFFAASSCFCAASQRPPPPWAPPWTNFDVLKYQANVGINQWRSPAACAPLFSAYAASVTPAETSALCAARDNFRRLTVSSEGVSRSIAVPTCCLRAFFSASCCSGDASPAGASALCAARDDFQQLTVSIEGVSRSIGDSSAHLLLASLLLGVLLLPGRQPSGHLCLVHRQLLWRHRRKFLLGLRSSRLLCLLFGCLLLRLTLDFLLLPPAGEL